MRKSALFIFILIVAVGHTLLMAQQMEEIHKTFDAKPTVRINTVSGDCIIKVSDANKIKVDLEFRVEPEGAMKPEFRETNNSLRIRERWHGRSTRGEVLWTITVPKETEIRFNTASGDLSATGLVKSVEASTASGDIEIEDSKGEFEISTASGDVDLDFSSGEFDISTASGEIRADNVNGMIELSTASGEIDVSDSKGEFDLSCASGDVTARGIFIEDQSSFSTASGDVDIVLGASSKYDLELSAASGDVTLDYNGNEVIGFFEFMAKKRRGRIIAPFDFDTEDEIEKWDQTYIRKTFKKGKSTPRIDISTATGRAVLKK